MGTTAPALTTGGAAVETLDKEIQETVALVGNDEITDTVDYEMAGEFLAKLKDLQKRAEDFIDPFVKDAYEAHRKATARKNALIDPIKNAIRTLQGKLSAWATKEEKRRQIEERMCSAQATEDAKAEARALADALQENGDTAGAEAVRKQAERTYVAVEAESTRPTIKGVKATEVWHYQIEDLAQLPREFMIPNEKAIANYAKMMKASAKIPGVRFWSTKEVR